MNVECKAGVTFLKINVMGSSRHLNPFRINTDHIHYIRKYKDSHIDAWAVFVGDKMYVTKDLNFDEELIGNVVEIGDTQFEVAVTTSLTDSFRHKTLINYKNVLYSRKYFKKDNKNDSVDCQNSQNIDTFAIITVDERIIPVLSDNYDFNQNESLDELDEFLKDDGANTNGAGGSDAGSPVPAENM